MNLVGFIVFILVGALAGYLGSRLLGGAGNGFLMNLVVGILGGLLGGALLGGLIPELVNFGGGVTLGGILTAVLGSALLLWILSLIKK